MSARAIPPEIYRRATKNSQANREDEAGGSARARYTVALIAELACVVANPWRTRNGFIKIPRLFLGFERRLRWRRSGLPPDGGRRSVSRKTRAISTVNHRIGGIVAYRHYQRNATRGELSYTAIRAMPARIVLFIYFFSTKRARRK